MVLTCLHHHITCHASQPVPDPSHLKHNMSRVSACDLTPHSSLIKFNLQFYIKFNISSSPQPGGCSGRADLPRHLPPRFPPLRHRPRRHCRKDGPLPRHLHWGGHFQVGVLLFCTFIGGRSPSDGSLSRVTSSLFAQLIIVSQTEIGLTNHWEVVLSLRNCRVSYTHKV